MRNVEGLYDHQGSECPGGEMTVAVEEKSRLVVKCLDWRSQG